MIKTFINTLYGVLIIVRTIAFSCKKKKKSVSLLFISKMYLSPQTWIQGSFKKDFKQDMCGQPKATFQTPFHSTSQGSVTHQEKSTIYPFMHKGACRCTRLASVPAIDRGKKERVHNSSHPENQGNFAPMDGYGQCNYSNL